MKFKIILFNVPELTDVKLWIDEKECPINSLYEIENGRHEIRLKFNTKKKTHTRLSIFSKRSPHWIAFNTDTYAFEYIFTLVTLQSDMCVCLKIGSVEEKNYMNSMVSIPSVKITNMDNCSAFNGRIKLLTSKTDRTLMLIKEAFNAVLILVPFVIINLLLTIDDIKNWGKTRDDNIIYGRYGSAKNIFWLLDIPFFFALLAILIYYFIKIKKYFSEYYFAGKNS